MSSNNNNRYNLSQPLYTKGEKCLFTHAVITFCLILGLMIIYLIHLFVVSHKPNEELRISRRVDDLNDVGYDLKRLLVGAVYIKDEPPKIICSSLLIRRQWSITSAQCVSLRSNPNVVGFFPLWRILYRTSSLDFMRSEIQKGIVNPNFSEDDLRNNVGLFKHLNISINPLPFFDNNALVYNRRNVQYNTMTIVGWSKDSFFGEGAYAGAVSASIDILPKQECFSIISYFTVPDEYEFCATPTTNSTIYFEHGAIFVLNNTIKGLFSWSEKQGRLLPFVFINISYYKSWITEVIELTDFI